MRTFSIRLIGVAFLFLLVGGPSLAVAQVSSGSKDQAAVVAVSATGLAPQSESDMVGGVQLDVQPWRAEVYVDGAYVGLVESYTGYYRPLVLAPGPHVIMMVAPDYDPLMFEVMVSPGQTITYRNTLTRAYGR